MFTKHILDIYVKINCNPVGSQCHVCHVIKCGIMSIASTRCGSMLVTVPHRDSMWLWFSDFHICFQVVCLSIPFVLTLCLKDAQLGNDSIYPKLLLTVVLVR